MVLSYPALNLRAQFIIGQKLLFKLSPNSDISIDLEYLVSGSGHLNMNIYDVFKLQSALSNGVLKSVVVAYGYSVNSVVSTRGQALQFAINGNNCKIFYIFLDFERFFTFSKIFHIFLYDKIARLRQPLWPILSVRSFFFGCFWM